MTSIPYSSTTGGATPLYPVFDVLGAVLIVLLDVRTFVPIAEQSLRTTSMLLLGAGGAIGVDSLLAGLGLVRGWGARSE